MSTQLSGCPLGSRSTSSSSWDLAIRVGGKDPLLLGAFPGLVIGSCLAPTVVLLSYLPKALEDSETQVGPKQSSFGPIQNLGVNSGWFTPRACTGMPEIEIKWDQLLDSRKGRKNGLLSRVPDPMLFGM